MYRTILNTELYPALTRWSNLSETRRLEVIRLQNPYHADAMILHRNECYAFWVRSETNERLGTVHCYADGHVGWVFAGDNREYAIAGEGLELLHLNMA